MASISGAIALGPIYWFMSVPFFVMFAVRSVLLFLVASLSFSGAVLLRKTLILYLLMIILISVKSSLVHADYFFLSILPAVIILTVGTQVAERIDVPQLRAALFSATIIFSLFCCVVLFDFIAGGMIADPFYTVYTVYLHDTGFNGGRTAWGYASNLFLAIALQHALTNPSEKSINGNLYFLPVLIIFLNIIIIGARGAFLVSLVIILLFISFSSIRKKLLSIFSFVLFSAFVYFAILRSDFAGEMRLVNTLLLAESRDLTTAVYRIATYDVALKAFMTSPLFGAGPVLIDAGVGVLQVHNVWLRFITERGILFFLPLVFFIVVLITSSVKSARRNGYELRLLVLAGFLTGMVEPNAIFGNYFVSVAFWLPIGFFLSVSFGGGNIARNVDFRQ